MLLQAEINKYAEICKTAYDMSPHMKQQKRDWLDSPWKGFFLDNGHAPLPEEIPATGISEEVLMKIAKQFASCPSDFNLHSGVWNA